MVLNIYKVICPSGAGYLIIAQDDERAAVVACRLDKLEGSQTKHCTVTLRGNVHG